jgi:rubrerythrin
MENLSALNLNKICRVCLSESEQMYSIYSELYEVQTEVDVPCIYEILIGISSIKVQADDGLPSMICVKCIDMAHTSFKFQKQCNQSQIILDAYMKQYPQIKTEISIEDLSTLEEINKNDLVQEAEQNELDPNDFLLVEEDIMAIKNKTRENVDKDSNLQVLSHTIEGMSDEEGSEFVDPLDINGSNIEGMSDEEDSEFVDPLDINGSNITEVLMEQRQNEHKETGALKVAQKAANRTKKYPCSLCDKSYEYSSSLRVHMRNHTQERPYGCSTCGKSFKQYSSMVYHQRSHTGEQPYVCKLCGKRYKQAGTLTAHMRVHTGQRPFLCSICGRGFRQASDLGYHMRLHTKEKPYMCNVCGKTMSMQSHLVQHMRIHTGERPYKCR